MNNNLETEISGGNTIGEPGKGIMLVSETLEQGE